MCERRISGSTWSTQIAKTGRSATAKSNMRRSDMQRITSPQAKRVRSQEKFIRKERSMPTYVCYLPRDRFSPDQKRQIVDAITFRHSEATGAPSYFVQVVIEEARADRFLGGEHTSDHIWVRGDIRAGRTEEQRTGMITKMMQDISLVTSVRQENVWIYLCNLGPTDMIEYGHVLPAPGQEKAWFESLPVSLRTYLAKLGTTKANFKL